MTINKAKKEIEEYKRIEKEYGRDCSFLIESYKEKILSIRKQNKINRIKTKMKKDMPAQDWINLYNEMQSLKNNN